MKLVIISDSHTRRFPVPNGDVLIHCGDHTFEGKAKESESALEWFNSHPHKYKIYIAGNHEIGWQRKEFLDYLIPRFAPDCIYLHNSGVEIEGVKFWGSPVQPDFYNWAFQLPRGQPLRDHWQTIPEDTDVLITHGPPRGIGDSDDHFGDDELLERVLQVKPKIHCFGHAHEGYGVVSRDGVVFANAAILNDDYRVAHLPIELTL